MNAPKALPLPGDICQQDGDSVVHALLAPVDDVDLQIVHLWLMSRPLADLLSGAVVDAISYVLDGSRTGRFDLTRPEVDSDERRTVGTKLQYRVLAALQLQKQGPLDTWILDTPVELKATVGTSWMIPREGQCQICLLIQLDTDQDRFRVFLMRTHRAWLNAANQDMKRTIRSEALKAFALPVVGWTDLPRNPLKRLSEAQRAIVFEPGVGQAKRLTALFGFLPGVVVPRDSILTVCANRDDPLRRAREVKNKVADELGLLLLCGKWKEDRAEALGRGFVLQSGDWLAVVP